MHTAHSVFSLGLLASITKRNYDSGETCVCVVVRRARIVFCCDCCHCAIFERAAHDVFSLGLLASITQRCYDSCETWCLSSRCALCERNVLAEGRLATMLWRVDLISESDSSVSQLSAVASCIASSGCPSCRQEVRLLQLHSTDWDDGELSFLIF